MTALPNYSQQEDPLDPERILRVLPDREHETFLAQYRRAVVDAHDPAGLGDAGFIQFTVDEAVGLIRIYDLVWLD